MQEQVESPQADLEPNRLGKLEFISQVLRGIAIAAGLGLLWAMETVRNAYFRLLDRLNVKPRKRRWASAFPPGKPRTRARSDSTL